MKTWKKLLRYSVSLMGAFFTCLVIVLACGGEIDPYDYCTSFFHADIQGKKDYSAFYFTDYQYTYDDTEPASEADINSAEWATYLGAPVKVRDVNKIMYKLDSAGKKDLVGSFDQDSPLADSLSSNSFLISLKQAGHEAPLQYYRLALEVEPLANRTYNEWNPAPVDTAEMVAAAKKALDAAGSTNDNFIKLRYYYQAQRLLHYGGNYEQARKIYEQYIAKIPSQSHVKGWALAYKAGEDRWLGDTTRAAHLFSVVFANYPERRLLAYQNYHYIGAQLNNVLQLAATPEEKANLYAIEGFSNSQLDINNLQQVYNNAPASPLVGVLLVREINKLEQYYLTPALVNNTDQFYSSQLNAKVPDHTIQNSVSKWPLFIGIFVLIAGIILLVNAIKKNTEKPAGKIAGGVLMVAGVVSVAWFTAGNFGKRHAAEESSLRGSFFVALPDIIKSKYDAHIGKLRSFCTKLTSDAKYTEPQIGTLTNAYLDFMQNHPDDGLSALNKLEGQPLSPKLDDQRQIVSLLLSAQRMKQVRAVDEASLLPALQWLGRKVPVIKEYQQGVYPEKPDYYNRFAITQRNFYSNVLAPAYLRQGDTAKAALVLLGSQNGSIPDYRYHMFRQMPDFWYNFLHAAHLKQMINWKVHKPADPYLAFLSKGLKQVDESALYELLGTIQLREHHYQDALASFRTEKAKLTYAHADEGGISNGDTFDATINDYPHLSRMGYYKLQFAQKMAELEVKLKDNPNNADAYFQMATGIYNTSTYANSWNLISYIWSSYDFGRKSIYYYDGDYIKASLAKQYYLKARELSTDPEVKAKCTFMAAKCEQKQHQAPSYDNNAAYDTYKKQDKEYLAVIRKNSYFKELQQFKATAFYKKAVGECSYFSDFIDGK